VEVGRDNQFLVDSTEAPIEDTDEHFQGRRADGEAILELEQLAIESKVGKKAACECQNREDEADNGQELVLTAPSHSYWVWISVLPRETG